MTGQEKSRNTNNHTCMLFISLSLFFSVHFFALTHYYYFMYVDCVYEKGGSRQSFPVNFLSWECIISFKKQWPKMIGFLTSVTSCEKKEVFNVRLNCPEAIDFYRFSL